MKKNKVKTLYLADPITTAARAKHMYYALWGFTVWSVLFASVGIFLVVGLIGRLNESCDSRQAGRTAYRAIVALDDDWTPEQQAILDEYLPAKVSC